MFQMWSFPTHPSITDRVKLHRARVDRWIAIFDESTSLPKPDDIDWQPKNDEIIWPNMDKEKFMSKGKWQSSKFPSHPLPQTVTGVVNRNVWEDKIAELSAQPYVNHGLIRIMKEVLVQLTIGASSGVQDPGTSITTSRNSIPDPGINIPRVADALASFVKAGHIAGPLFINSSQLKINSILAVPKPGGHIRVVGNLSHPSGRSFNDGIPEIRKQEWPVEMLTISQFTKMIIHAGKGAFLSCCDMKDAYKMMPVTLEQRQLQGYKFCGAIFIELKMIFGDKMACLFFDRFYFAIMKAFVHPVSSVPRIAQGRTVDDIPTVVPSIACSSLQEFVISWRNSLRSLNISPANDDPTHTKAFDCSNEGEVLGIRFDTISFTWSLPYRKLYKLVDEVYTLADRSKPHSLRELEVVAGKINYLSALFPPFRMMFSDTMFAIAEHVRKIGDENGQVSDVIRDKKSFSTTSEVSTDLRMIAAILVDSYEHPLPIVDPSPPIPLGSMPIYTDASGQLKGSSPPALGIYFPPFNWMHSRAYSIQFPTDFLLSANGKGLIANTTSTLEAMGLLLPLMLQPQTCVGKDIHVYIDNLAVVFAFKKRRSEDLLAQSLLRAALLVAGALACRLFVSWVPRRSNTGSSVADDLTHGNFTSSIMGDPHGSQCVLETFPDPIRCWMENPVYDRDLGHKVLEWMKTQCN